MPASERASSDVTAQTLDPEGAEHNHGIGRVLLQRACTLDGQTSCEILTGLGE